MEPLWMAMLGALALAGLLVSGRQLWALRQAERLRQARLQQAMPPDAALSAPDLSLQTRAWSRWPALDAVVPRWRGLRRLDRLASAADWPVPLLDTLGATVLLSLALAALVWGSGVNPLWSLAVALGLPLLLGGLLLQRRSRRLARIDAQLPDALDIMARSMQAGHAFSSALQIAATETPMPLSQELQRMFDELHFGHGLQQTLPAFTERVDTEEVKFFVTSVLIQRETGGDLAALLLSTSALIRERQALAGQVRVLSAEGRLSAWVLSLLPLVLGGVMAMLNPRFMAPLWEAPAGQRLLLVAVLLWCLGVLWMARLVRIRV